MPAFNFQRQFADDVEHGRKSQTIRAKRRHRPKAGQTAHCFTGMRTSACRLLGRWPIVHVENVIIDDDRVILMDHSFDDGCLVTDKELDRFARSDGFADWSSMLSWFEKTHGLPFVGDLVMWDWRPQFRAALNDAQVHLDFELCKEVE
jgi:hypothetical protein